VTTLNPHLQGFDRLLLAHSDGVAGQNKTANTYRAIERRFAALERSADLRVAWPKLPRASSTLPALSLLRVQPLGEVN
jgi:hypothetical protein